MNSLINESEDKSSRYVYLVSLMQTLAYGLGDDENFEMINEFSQHLSDIIIKTGCLSDVCLILYRLFLARLL